MRHIIIILSAIIFLNSCSITYELPITKTLKQTDIIEKEIPTFTITLSLSMQYSPTSNNNGWQTHGPTIKTSLGIVDLVIDPQTPTTIYASLFYNQLLDQLPIYKSVDGGLIWEAVGNGLSGINIYAMVIDPIKPTTLYVGTFGHGVYKSEDGGLNWNSSNNGLNNIDIIDLTINPLVPTILYAVSQSHIYKSENGGKSWRRIDYGYTYPSWGHIAIDPITPSTLYIIHAHLGIHSVCKSINNGDNWAIISNVSQFGFAQNIIIDPENTKILFIGTNNGLIKSVNSGKDWVFVKSDLKNNSIWSLAINATTLYFGTNNLGVFKSENKGEDWVSLGLENIPIEALAINPSQQNKIYAATEKGVYILNQS